MSVLLQLFLLANVFFLGAITALAIQHGIAHFKPKNKPELHPPKTITLTPEAKARLLRAAETDFQAALNRSAINLQGELAKTTNKLNELLENLGGEIVGTEMERYRVDLVQIRRKVESALSGAQSELGAHQTKLIEEFKAKLADEMAAEKQRLINQLDTKLADAVASFLSETLQHNIDLGAQSTYLTTLLEQHKAEFIKEVADESEAAK